VQDALDELDAPARSRIDASLSGEGLVRGDGPLLRTLFINLLDNALKFSQGRVGVVLSDRAGQVRLELRDAGPGIPEPLRERVFQPFFRIRADAARGTGLGLALVRKIALAHDGTVEVASADPGTIVTILLPHARDRLRRTADPA
jgi:signal transduction histidine kinase